MLSILEVGNGNILAIIMRIFAMTVSTFSN